MPVDDFKTIDFASLNETKQVAVLTISDHLDWEDSHTHQLILQDKFNAYLRFTENGEMAERLPHLANLPVEFNVRFLYEPDKAGLAFLAKAAAVIESAGFSLTYKIAKLH